MFRHEVYTDASGIYRLPPMPSDGTDGHDLRITVMAEGWSPDMKQISYSPKTTASISRPKPGKQLRLRFVDESGKPILGVYVSINDWRNGKSLYNSKHPMLLDAKIAEKADETGVYEWTWAPEDKVAYSYGKQGLKGGNITIAADGLEHVIRLTKVVVGQSGKGDAEGQAIGR